MQNMNMRQMMMAAKSGNFDAILTNKGENGVSFAQIFALWINWSRMDARAMARANGEDIATERMTEQDAADLLSNVFSGDPSPVLATIRDMQRRRDVSLQHMVDEDGLEQLATAKRAVAPDPLQVTVEEMSDVTATQSDGERDDVVDEDGGEE